ncbi:MAG: helix-turn-helix transcriptional regulator [Clostridia bacterium]|nr:helix-turn-helix transcriptional regulator [Clostridia bacterium]
MKESMTLGERLSSILEEKGVTVLELANKTEHSSLHVDRWCSDSIIPKATDLSDIAKALDITTVQLVELLNL